MGEIGHEELLRPHDNEERILVSVRLRPLNTNEIERNDQSDWECINDNTIIFRNSFPDRSMPPTAYTFDRVFRRDCSTKQVYEEGAKEVALSVVSGINSSIFAYGQTSSGKTYTMTGITEYTVADIYDYIQKHQERAFVLKFSAMEIYNEAVIDLLSTDGTPLRLLDDPERGIVVDKLTEETLTNWNHLQKLLSICEAQRQIGETSLNETSSRSHQILRLTIESSAREFLGKDNSSTLFASVNFVDLAGSERASQALSAGARLKEGCHINRSLLTLGTVIRKLSSKSRNGHIPYRDSKLTRILQSSLGGNARTAIICTMSPARSHVEQSRNTLFFASCAKQVVTSAHVNVVMSDKALVKHLQKELARLESALRSPGPPYTTNHSEAIRNKDAQIEKMQKEIKELTQQRDLAQSRLQDLLRVVGYERASRLREKFSPPSKSCALNSREDELLLSEPSGADRSVNFGLTRFHASRFSEECWDSNCREQYLQISRKPKDHGSGDISNQISVSSSSFAESVPDRSQEENALDTNSAFEALCKEVQCIQIEESSTNRKKGFEASFPEENEDLLALTATDNWNATHQEEARDFSDVVDTDLTVVSLEQQLQNVQKSIENCVRQSPDESSPWPLPTNLAASRSLQLTKSRSCKENLMTASSSQWFWDAEQNENTPPSTFEKGFPGRPGGFRRKLTALNYGAEFEAPSRGNSQISERSDSIDVQKAQNMYKTAAEENISSIRSFVVELKDRMTKLQYQKQLLDDQGTEPKTSDDCGSEITIKDVGLDTLQSPAESQSLLGCTLEFERQNREIIELWHTCNISLAHRTYFFLLFKGDPNDSIYMTVELRRLSFLKSSMSKGGSDKTSMGDGKRSPVSSMRALRREREMLSKQMQRRLSNAEREELYRKWGIGLDTKQRRLQLARRIWSETGDMDHIRESAAVVAKLVGFLEQGEALKEMFGLSFTPRQTSGKSYSWMN